MDAQATEHADVVVVGAGPTGLLLAGDLVESGVRVVLLECRAGESNLTRAFAVHARTMEQLQSGAVPAEGADPEQRWGAGRPVPGRGGGVRSASPAGR